MTLQQFIEAKKAEFEKEFGPRMFHPFTPEQLKGGSIISAFLAAALREGVIQAFEAVRVEIPQRCYDGYPDEELKAEGFAAAVEAQEKKINDYLK